MAQHVSAKTILLRAILWAIPFWIIIGLGFAGLGGPWMVYLSFVIVPGAAIASVLCGLGLCDVRGGEALVFLTVTFNILFYYALMVVAQLIFRRLKDGRRS